MVCFIWNVAYTMSTNLSSNQSFTPISVQSCEDEEDSYMWRGWWRFWVCWQLVASWWSLVREASITSSVQLSPGSVQLNYTPGWSSVLVRPPCVSLFLSKQGLLPHFGWMQKTTACCNVYAILINKVEDFGGLLCAIGWMLVLWGDIVKLWFPLLKLLMNLA